MNTADVWGIEQKYQDAMGQWHEISLQAKSALLRAMDVDELDEPESAALTIINEGTELPINGAAEIELEDGTRLRAANRLPPNLPMGYHKLRDLSRGRETRLIVTPQQCYLPADLRVWGWALQLYALRSQASWGIGDLEDLRQFSNWSAEKDGAGVIMTNPLCAATPGVPQQASPYFPSSRLYLNPLYLRIEEIPGAQTATNLDELARQGRVLNDEPLINRDAIYRLKMTALEAIWSATRERVNFQSYEREQGRQLDLFATFCVLAEKYGANWRKWPQSYCHPDSSGVSAIAREFADRIRFHKWVQCLLDSQIKRCSENGTLMRDLPVGVDPDGADAWMWQDVFAKGISVGAPPDAFNAKGQDWGLPPFVPHKLRAAGYEPFIQTVRSAMRYSAGLRIDHVMGLSRLFWIPNGAAKTKGTYVRYRANELFSILAVESVRAKTFVVGEDLGTVDDSLRASMARFRVLSYRLMWFDENPPERYPQLAAAAVTTHDLPTIAGVWSGADFAEQQQLGLEPKKENSEQLRQQLKKFAHVTDDAPIGEVISKTHEAIAHAPSAVILASLEDALGVKDRPNLPGSEAAARPNWCIPLPIKLEEILNNDLVHTIATTLRRNECTPTITAEDEACTTDRINPKNTAS
jgi:4-alpha-glucanotransferase